MAGESGKLLMASCMVLKSPPPFISTVTFFWAETADTMAIYNNISTGRFTISFVSATNSPVVRQPGNSQNRATLFFHPGIHYIPRDHQQQKQFLCHIWLLP